MDIKISEELVLLKFEDRDSTEPVMFGSSVCLQTPDQYFLSFNGNGELRVERNPKFDIGNNSIAKLTKWQIFDAKNITNRNIVTPFDDICLKSPFGHYF